MFTGLIEEVGQLRAPVGAKSQLRIASKLSRNLALGESLAVNGVCLTVTAIEADEILVDVGPETARVTTLGLLRPGESVNLERPMRGDGRFGGHFVQGHVDGTGALRGIRTEGDAHWLTIAFESLHAAYLIPKGSIAVDGVSLTVATLAGVQFDVMIVPFTWAHTNLSERRVGDRVNLEYDLVGKYVIRAVELAGAKP